MASLRHLRFALLVASATGFYLPGVAVREYSDGERVEIKVNKLSSTKTQLPYDYYSLPFCKPEEISKQAENLGEVLHGSVIQTRRTTCTWATGLQVLCRQELNRAKALLPGQEDYRAHLILDEMIREMPDGDADRLELAGRPYLYNHLRFVIKFHKEESFVGSRIVGFEVEPLSVKHQYKGKFTTDMASLNLLTVPVGPDLPPQPIEDPKQGTAEVIFTYDVKWEYSDIKWASRWDLYLYMGDDQIHWFSIINSLAIVLLLTGIVAMIMMRTLRRDFNRCSGAAQFGAQFSAQLF